VVQSFCKDKNTIPVGSPDAAFWLSVTCLLRLSLLCVLAKTGGDFMCVSSQLTVFFDDPFWVGVYERTDNGHLEVARVVFGAEPKDYEVYAYMLKNYPKLKFSRPVEGKKQLDGKINPKRRQRRINSQLSQEGIGTKAQQALKLLQEEGKIKRRRISRQMKEAEQQRKFALRQEKKKAKHKGR